jgi:hypothetical protein
MCSVPCLKMCELIVHPGAVLACFAWQAPALQTASKLPLPAGLTGVARHAFECRRVAQRLGAFYLQAHGCKHTH